MVPWPQLQCSDLVWDVEGMCDITSQYVLMYRSITLIFTSSLMLSVTSWPSLTAPCSLMILFACIIPTSCLTSKRKSTTQSSNRVHRFDSFSKIFSACMCIGYVTAPLPLLEHINMHIEGTNLHNCGVIRKQWLASL